MTNDPKNRDVEKQPKSGQKIPPAGPHAKPELTDKKKTPGTGMLPEKNPPEVEGPSG